MKFTVETKKELTIFKLHENRLDASIAPELKSEFVVLIEAENKKYLIIDLAQVDAIDSSGIGALLMAHRQAADHNGFAAYVGVKNKVRDLLKMTGLDKQLYIFSSLQEALNSIEAVDTEDETEVEEVVTSKKSRRIHDDDDDEFLMDIPSIDDIDEEALAGEPIDGEFGTDDESDEDESPKATKPTKEKTKKSKSSESTKKSRKKAE